MRWLLPFRASRMVLTGLVLLFGASGERTFAQVVSDEQVKAAYLYSFAKFVDWPAQEFANAAVPLRFCIWKDRSIAGELEQIVKDKSIAGHPLNVQLVSEEPGLRECHVLFMSRETDAVIRRILEAIRGAPVLTVGDSDDFAEQGGMINFVLQRGRVQFEINHKAAKSAGLYISSRMLGVAKRVLE